MSRSIGILQKTRFWAGFLLAQFLLFSLLSRNFSIVTFASHFFEWRKTIQSELFSPIPFSAGDVLYTILAVSILYNLIGFLFKKKNRYLRTVFIILNVFYFIYQFFWGLLYFQPPVSDRLPQKEISDRRIEYLIEKYLYQCIEDRHNVQENHQGIFKITDPDKLKSIVLKNQTNIPIFITDKAKIKTVNMKASLFRTVMSYTGILGYYNPFTSEVQYNPDLPDTSIPFTLAHETAHQSGFAREQEANFIGYLIGKNARDADLKYSTNYFVLKSLLNYYNNKNPDVVQQILQKYSPGMKRDRMNEKAFAEQHKGWLDTVFGISNDLFLKSNKQEGRITYSYFIYLLNRYEQ